MKQYSTTTAEITVKINLTVIEKDQKGTIFLYENMSYLYDPSDESCICVDCDKEVNEVRIEKILGDFEASIVKQAVKKLK